MRHIKPAVRHAAPWLLVLALALVTPACGGGSTAGPGPEGAGQNLVLVGFLQAGVDNTSINTMLEFTFSEAVAPDSVSSGAIQIREGPDFGRTAKGEFTTVGTKVYFQPELPTDCALQTAGFKPGTTYRITVTGYPETYCVKNTQGQSLDRTTTYEFLTLPDTADDVLQDQIPSQAPYVVSSSPQNAEAAVAVAQGNEVVIEFSENIDPCSVTPGSVLFQVFELGDPDLFEGTPDQNPSGFIPREDSAPGDDYSWGATNSTAVSPPQIIPANIELMQSNESTVLRVRPKFGEFPDNALIVVELTFGIRDFGGDPLATTTFKFTTENLEPQAGSFTVDFDDATPIDKAATTADVNTARSPSRVQGWLLFAGDGDSGSSPSVASPPPTFPIAANSNCNNRTNFGAKTPFDPGGDVTLNTGATRNQVCENTTDGSTAVVWEFSTFTIRSGVTVRIIGVNPAIILVQGDAIIENGGRLLVRGDGSGGSPKGTPAAGNGYYTTSGQYPSGADGGIGVAGGSDGGASNTVYSEGDLDGDDGMAGFGSPDYDTGDEEGGLGAGEGQVGAQGTSSYSNAGCSAGGGGGGHATVGSDGQAFLDSTTQWMGPIRGGGGGVYPDGANANKLYTPSAGSGGGAAGSYQGPGSYSYMEAPGGGGGAGGGFVDLTSGGDIKIYGTIDAAGSRGGPGQLGYYSNYLGSAGGGGGSGGGIRLLTPNDIDITGGTLTTSGGGGGAGRLGTSKNPTAVANSGGAGGNGRIVLEDGDSIITGFSSATMMPSEGADGFYRAKFDATRFQGGGLQSDATTGLMFLGPISPPAFAKPELADFVVGIPTAVSNGDGATSILVEVQGYPLLPDGRADTTAPTGWYTAGYFITTVSGPGWVEGANPGDVALPPDNMGAGIGMIDGSCYVQLRVSFWLPNSTGASQPGPYIDRWNIRFAYDQ
jgi:hypothetical protein